MAAPSVLILRGLRLEEYRSPETLLEERLLGEDYAAAPAGAVLADAESKRGADNNAATFDATAFGAGAATYNSGHASESIDLSHSAPIPTKFRCIEEWSLQSPYACWTCGGECVGAPRFCPTYLNKTPDGDFELGVEGVMCSFACVARYIDDLPATKTERDRRQALLLEECEAFTGTRPAYIPAGPRRTALQRYGGDMTRAAFNAMLDAIEAPLGVPDAAELQVRKTRHAGRAREGDSNALCMNEYKQQVTALGLLK